MIVDGYPRDCAGSLFRNKHKFSLCSAADFGVSGPCVCWFNRTDVPGELTEMPRKPDRRERGQRFPNLKEETRERKPAQINTDCCWCPVSGARVLLEGVRPTGSRCYSGQIQPTGTAGGPGQPTGSTHTHTHSYFTRWLALNRIFGCVSLCVFRQSLQVSGTFRSRKSCGGSRMWWRRCPRTNPSGAQIAVRPSLSTSTITFLRSRLHACAVLRVSDVLDTVSRF